MNLKKPYIKSDELLVKAEKVERNENT